jgi:hypothetical protein
MSNPYFTASGYPATNAAGTSATLRTELLNIQAGFDMLPVLSGNGGKLIAVNTGGTALAATTQLTYPTYVTNDGYGWLAKTLTTAGYAGFAVLNSAGTRKLEMLFTDSAYVGSLYGAPAGSAVVNATGGCYISTADTARALFDATGNITFLSGTTAVFVHAGGGLKTQLAASSSFGGLTVTNESGSRKIELLYAGSTNAGFYGISANQAVLNIASTVGQFAIAMGDTVKITVAQSTGNTQFGGAVGINNKSPVTSAVAPTAAGASYTATEQALLNDIRTRLINFGIYA